MPAEARDAMFEAAAGRLPARRIGQASDVAQAILYVASNGYATGSTVLVDGGGAIA
jgi:NAD(P)-dependent dehydrogenase (short-subunit alcohol dehydrogenase family)